MDKNITPSTVSYTFGTINREKNFPQSKYASPSEKTLHFLRTFARNYKVSSLLPESLPGFVLG